MVGRDEIQPGSGPRFVAKQLSPQAGLKMLITSGDLGGPGALPCRPGRWSWSWSAPVSLFFFTGPLSLYVPGSRAVRGKLREKNDG